MTTLCVRIESNPCLLLGLLEQGGGVDEKILEACQHRAVAFL